MTEICTDNRFELIEKYKKALLEGTNIEDSQDEMNVIDNVLFRFWQMGWLDGSEIVNRQKAEIERLHCILLAFTDQVHTWSNNKGYDTTELSLIPILNEAKDIKKQVEAEAIKEFAERLKAEALTKCDWKDCVDIEDIDNLVKEMTEEKK